MYNHTDAFKSHIRKMDTRNVKCGAWMSGHETRIAKPPNCGISICWRKSQIETD